MTYDMIDPEKLAELESEVAKLPRAIQPPDEAWTNIRSAIERESVTPIAGVRSKSDVRFWQRPAFLAAAAAALIVATSTTTMIALRRDAAPARTAVEAPARPSNAFVQFAARENNYIATANQLEAVIESSQSTLSPETIAKLKRSIAIIDAAILEARQALAEDPANRDLLEMLTSSYDKKLDLLRRSAAMGRS